MKNAESVGAGHARTIGEFGKRTDTAAAPGRLNPSLVSARNRSEPVDCNDGFDLTRCLLRPWLQPGYGLGTVQPQLGLARPTLDLKPRFDLKTLTSIACMLAILPHGARAASDFASNLVGLEPFSEAGGLNQPLQGVAVPTYRAASAPISGGAAHRRQRRRLPDATANRPLAAESIAAKEPFQALIIRKIPESRWFKSGYTLRDLLRILKRATNQPFLSLGEDSIKLIEWCKGAKVDATTRKSVETVAQALNLLETMAVPVSSVLAVRNLIAVLTRGISDILDGKPVDRAQLFDDLQNLALRVDAAQSSEKGIVESAVQIKNREIPPEKFAPRFSGCRLKRSPGSSCDGGRMSLRAEHELAAYRLTLPQLSGQRVAIEHGLIRDSDGTLYIRGQVGYYRVALDINGNVRVVMPGSADAGLHVPVERDPHGFWNRAEPDIDGHLEAGLGIYRIPGSRISVTLSSFRPGIYVHANGKIFVKGKLGFYRIKQDVFGTRVVLSGGGGRPLSGVFIEQNSQGVWRSEQNPPLRPRLGLYDAEQMHRLQSRGVQIQAAGLLEIVERYPERARQIINVMERADILMDSAVGALREAPEWVSHILADFLGIEPHQVDEAYLTSLRRDLLRMREYSRHFAQDRGRRILTGQMPNEDVVACVTAGSNLIIYPERFFMGQDDQVFAHLHEISHVYSQTRDYFYYGTRFDRQPHAFLNEVRAWADGDGPAGFASILGPNFAQRTGELDDAAGILNFRLDPVLRTEMLRRNADTIAGLVLSLGNRPTA